MARSDRNEESARDDAAHRGDTARSPADQPQIVTRPVGARDTTQLPRSDPEADDPLAPPIVGVAVIYAESFFRKESEPASELGAVYQLHEGDLLFIGKHPAPTEVVLGNGRRSKVAASHLFPYHPVGRSNLGKGYAYISGQHMTLEMSADGVTVVRDFSRNGVYLDSQKRHLSTKEEVTEEIELVFEGARGVRKQAVTKTFTGPETIVLGINMDEASAESRELAQQQQILVIPFVSAQAL